MMSDDEKPRTLTPSGARRVPANPEIPKLRKKTEERIAPADEKSAAAYDALEVAAEKMAALKQQIDDGHVMVEMEITDTAVHRLKKI